MDGSASGARHTRIRALIRTGVLAESAPTSLPTSSWSRCSSFIVSTAVSNRADPFSPQSQASSNARVGEASLDAAAETGANESSTSAAATMFLAPLGAPVSASAAPPLECMGWDGMGWWAG